MNKELQNLAWSILPKEFKEEVKSHYAGLNAAYQAFLSKDSLTNAECDRCNVMRENIALYNMYFGRHNLTSDAEGEEMLTVPRKKVQNIRAQCDETMMDDNPNLPATIVDAACAKMELLNDLFGAKCLPDEEPKAAEPQESPRQFYRVMGTDEHGIPFITQIPPQFAGPYDISTEGAAHCDNQLEAEPEENHIPDPEKHFDTILKDGFREHNRLHIAAIAMQGILSNADRMKQYGEIAMRESKSLTLLVARNAMRYADTLIAECEKGDSK